MPQAPAAAEASEEGRNQTDDEIRQEVPPDCISLQLQSEMSAVRQCQSFNPRAHNYHF